MPTFGHEPETNGGGRQRTVAAVFFILAVAASYLPTGTQQRASWVLRASILRPFLSTQQRLADARLRALDVESLQAQLDSLAATLATHSAVEEENRSLRALVGLGARLGPSFRARSVLRSGVRGSESTFLVELGPGDGIKVGNAVVDRHGLVGKILEVRSGRSVAMDWTHPDFRASAMLADGTGFGIVETRRGLFREDDRLVLNGTAYYEEIPEGTLVLTSGLGVYPRGIPIGSIDEVDQYEGRWRKSYFLRPMVHPALVTHVLVQVGDGLEGVDLAWPADSAVATDEAVLLIRADSLALLRRLLEERGDTVGPRRP
jgi:rod shape-determining protein MreC